MRSKNFITRCLLSGLAVLTVFSLAGCKKEDKEVTYEEKPFYANQYKNERYYCQQGYSR